MFLKRIELQGFKSFAHKTVIELQDGATIVVGPNGCGKSNVLDAIRWVLGEKSAKSLRGSKMGDVVFRGSSALKQAHFAQVNLVVNNEAGHLKMDHSEVVVTRRLFSNGDSEYLINKQKARMRDIHELFLDTGLGADGYSIIEQGQIGLMVAAKPAERRALFEEAAGISRYKARREETLRKLIRTEEDLLRLFDIVSEVERSCNSLYRQAKKAERHGRYSRRLRRLQKRLLVRRHELLEEKLGTVGEELSRVRKDFEEAAGRLASAEAKRAESARLLEDFQSRYQDLQQQRYDAQAAVNREQRRIESARQTMEAVAERRALLERELTSQGNRLSVLGHTMTALEADLRRERGALEERSAAAEEKNARLEALRRDHDEVTRRAAQLRHELETERAREAKVLQDKRLAESLIERLGAELESHDEVVERLQAEANEAREQADRAREELAKRRDTMHDLREQLQKFKAEISHGNAEKSELAAKVEEVTREHQRAASRLQALQELEDSYEGFYRGVQVVMRAAQGGKLQGVIGVLTNLLTVESRYETAIEVALGGALQDIVTEREQDAQAAIRMLKESRSGRATFLPLDLLKPNVRYDHLREVVTRSGVVGFARDLVRFEPRVERAVERRLGNTIVVETLPVAVGLQREGVRNRYVSLEGELVDPSGVMTGGSHQSRGLLTRTREIRELRDKTEELDKERKELGGRLSAMSDRLSQCHAQAAELQAQLHEEQMAEARAEKDLQASESRSRERRNALATAEARQVQQRHDLQRHRETIEECETALGELSGRIKEREKALGELESGSPERSTELASLADEASEARAAVSGLRERVSGLEAKIAELRRDREGAGEEQQERRKELDELDEREAAAREEERKAEELLGELVRERDGIEAQLSTMTQENEQSLRKAREGQAEVQALQRDRNAKENVLREAESKATELRAQIDFLSQEAEEEFGEGIAALREELKGPAANGGEALVSPSGEDDEEEENGRQEEELHAADEEVEDPAELRRLVNELREKISRMGAVNETAIEEYKEQKERLDFLTGQRDDLIAAKDSLNETIRNLDETTSRLFHEAYEEIRKNYRENFRRLFSGGEGDLRLLEQENEPEPGIEVFAQPPGKKIGESITLLSGGERALTAIALTIAMFQFRPSPICVLDEIDAPLDDANCRRLCDMLAEYSRNTQFLIITHNKVTMSLADTVYGVTMQEPGISKLVSVQFDKIEESGVLENGAAG